MKQTRSLAPALMLLPLSLMLLPTLPAGCTSASNLDTQPSTVEPGEGDSDGDGFSDEDEINGNPGTDPFDPTDNPDNVRDTDGDGCSDYDETNVEGACNNDPLVPDGEPPADSVSITGSLRIGTTSLIDGDTNDPTNTVVANNAETLSQTQIVPNPCTLGGYLGLIDQQPDISDVYRIQLAAGQTATLLLADPDANDFDLWLYDETGSPVASSEGFGRAEQVAAPNGGTFFLEVYGFSVEFTADPGGLYTLVIGSSSLTALMDHADRLSSLHDFVDGEVLIRYRPGVTKAAAPSAADGVELQVITPAKGAGGIERARIVSFRQPNAKAKPTAATAGPPWLHRPHSETIAAIKQLRRRPDIHHAEPNYIHHTFATPNDEFYPLQWHYEQIGLPAAWDITTGDTGVIVAVIDTGVVLDHPDLQAQLVPGYDFISDPQTALDGDGIDPDPDDPGDQSSPGGKGSFHGTHVAGTIAANTNNTAGVAGVAWNARIMPLRALGKGGTGTTFDILEAMRFAAGLPNSSGQTPDEPADIINLSLGGPGISAIYQEVVDAVRGAGVMVIAASGNEAADADFYSPAGLDGVVTVSALDSYAAVTYYSNFGTSLEVAAPGGDTGIDADFDGWPDGIQSTLGLDGGGFTYGLLQGTSMACPHVAGVVALMKAVHPQMTPTELDLLLAGEHPGTSVAITEDLGDPGKDTQYGYGMINAHAAVGAAQEAAGAGSFDFPVLSVSPRDLDFGSDLSSAEVTVTNAGTAALEVQVTTSDSWLSVTPSGGGEGVYVVAVDRTALNDGVYSGSAEFTSNGGATTVAVRMTVGELGSTGGDIGTVYVLLVDPQNLTTAGQFNATAGAGYTFRFDNVTSGDYLLFAGTDMDDDLFIDNTGEALGAYPALSKPEQVHADQTRAGLTFAVSFSVNLQTPTAASVAQQPTPLLRRVAPPFMGGAEHR